MTHDWTIYIFMTLLNVLATPEEIIKIYIQKKSYAILIIHLLKNNTKMRDFCLYTRYTKCLDFNRIKIAISLDLTKIY